MDNTPKHFVDSRDFARIARAVAFIDAHAGEQPGLRVVAQRAGLSEFHFNRLFRRWAGLTPKQYLQWVTGTAAGVALAAEPTVLGAAHAVGLSGPGRLHDLMVQLHALTPAEVRSGGAGVRGWYGQCHTPFGTALMAGTARGLCHLAFLDPGAPAATAALRARWPAARFDRDDARAAALARRLWSGGDTPADLLLQSHGTHFQLQVWQALLALPAGTTVTYTDVALSIGRASGVRAVAGAIAANDIAWLIPCHRVLRRGGALGGYRWGEERKRAMLAWERVNRLRMQKISL